MPKVSICIPTYNQVEFLKENLESIVIQDYNDYEVVITDDSEDNRVRDFLLRYSNALGNRLKYFKNSHRLGTPENWNESIRKASGEFIKILHHDDSFSRKDSLLKFVQLLENNPSVNFVFSATYINSKLQVHKIPNDAAELLKTNPLYLIANNLIGAPSTTIFRRSSACKFDTNLKWLVDVDFYIRTIAKNNFSFIYCPDLLITTCAGESHQVTNECIENKEVEVCENLYLIDKIDKPGNKYTIDAINKCILHVIGICKKHKISNVNDIRVCGYEGEIHTAVKQFLLINSFSSFIGKLYLKFLRKIQGSLNFCIYFKEK